MSANTPGFTVKPIDYETGLPELRAVRETVFVQEQNVPLEEEWDALDPQCLHVIARDDAGRPIGTGRLTPEHKVGRMAVLREWRGKGVGDAMLLALIEVARQRGWRELALNSQVSASAFYTRHGFVPYGERFWEAGIEHQAMRRKLDGATAVEDRDAAIATTVAIALRARRNLYIYSRELDPGLFDAPEVLEALRRYGTGGHGGEARILLQDADAVQHAHAPLLGLAQRLPSVFVFREVDDPADRAYPSAFVANDTGGYYFRGLGHRFDGETDLDGAGRARQLAESFRPIWERSRPCTEFRALGL
ncbi:GNAT family N-acetyltransferase [Luteimonas sp. SX5]|uniref:GNAT family N-acetyltransferase n=1 Tax=Luteimonas galliterrae TaxID=2940486 RepID=A0ABT0MGJ0_9GAMM|nr:GNAT family N-acetyltransferase [Luteimonas galliterrae]MCL1633773.1 GNAT family N-acetyltransferase [Luteimonas galliterrae]